MITGAVKRYEARIRLMVIGRRGGEHEVEAVIDSGFTGTLTLPPAVIAMLGLRWRSTEFATLADGSTRALRMFPGRVRWDRRVRTVLIVEADTDPLVGMRLLKGHEFNMQIRYGGKVTIKRLLSN